MEERRSNVPRRHETPIERRWVEPSGHGVGVRSTRGGAVRRSRSYPYWFGCLHVTSNSASEEASSSQAVEILNGASVRSEPDLDGGHGAWALVGEEWHLQSVSAPEQNPARQGLRAEAIADVVDRRVDGRRRRSVEGQRHLHRVVAEQAAEGDAPTDRRGPLRQLTP